MNNFRRVHLEMIKIEIEKALEKLNEIDTRIEEVKQAEEILENLDSYIYRSFLEKKEVFNYDVYEFIKNCK